MLSTGDDDEVRRGSVQIRMLKLTSSAGKVAKGKKDNKPRLESEGDARKRGDGKVSRE